MLVMFGHEAWVLKFLLVYGRVRVDLLRMIEDGRPDLIARLTTTDRASLDDLGPRTFEAFNALKHVPTELRADWSASIDQAVDPRGDFGLSRWASQQVVEKLLKTFIRKHGGVVPQGRALQHPHELRARRVQQRSAARGSGARRNVRFGFERTSMACVRGRMPSDFLAAANSWRPIAAP